MGNVLGNYLSAVSDLFPGLNSENLAPVSSDGALGKLRRYLRDLKDYVDR